MSEFTVTLSGTQLQLVRTLLEFHKDSDEPGEYYPEEIFNEVCGKFGVVAPEFRDEPNPGFDDPG